MRTFSEPAREIPVADDCDVVVCGSGPAGVTAAVAAARTGASVRLIEAHGCLGGIWTAGLLSWVIDAADKPGIMAEITRELDRRGARDTRVPGGRNFAYNAEAMKLLLEEMCGQAGVRMQLHTRVTAAGKAGGNRMAVAITESRSGRQAWAGKAFVDATGDGDLAAQAGCGFDYGHPETGLAQPMSLVVLVTGVRFEEIESFVGGNMHEPKDRLLAEMRRAGVSPSYEGPTLFRIRPDLFALMANHEYGVSAMDAAGVTEATVRARAEVHRLVDALRSLGAPWAGMRIVATPEQIGVREGRRIFGRYAVTQEDLLNGARHRDAVCRVNFGIDVHATDPGKTKEIEPNPIRSRPYDIPLRALIARDVDGLLMAGRCISGDFLAHSSYRVTGDAAAMGQAAGATAALAAKSGRLPQDVPWPEVEGALAALNR